MDEMDCTNLKHWKVRKEKSSGRCIGFPDSSLPTWAGGRARWKSESERNLSPPLSTLGVALRSVIVFFLFLDYQIDFVPLIHTHAR